MRALVETSTTKTYLSNRLTLNVVHPVTQEEPIYMEYNKSDSKDVLIEKEDGVLMQKKLILSI